jgi:calcineurin-like phosphoesterase family protein
MIKIEKDRKVFITSDTHYGHKNICRGVTAWRLPDGSIPIDQTRDFVTIDEMNETIINHINSTVGEDDVLIHLGDWSFGGFENIKKFRDRILCKEIHLILGNHDHHIENNREDCQELFTSVSHYNTLKVDEHTFRLMHYPISSWDGLNKGIMHLHGHCHLPTNLRFGKGQRMDIGIDGNPDFKPYDVRREVVKLLRHRDKVSDMLFDHHTDEVITEEGRKRK